MTQREKEIPLLPNHATLALAGRTRIVGRCGVLYGWEVRCILASFGYVRICSVDLFVVLLIFRTFHTKTTCFSLFNKFLRYSLSLLHSPMLYRAFSPRFLVGSKPSTSHKGGCAVAFEDSSDCCAERCNLGNRSSCNGVSKISPKQGSIWSFAIGTARQKTPEPEVEWRQSKVPLYSFGSNLTWIVVHSWQILEHSWQILVYSWRILVYSWQILDGTILNLYVQQWVSQNHHNPTSCLPMFAAHPPIFSKLVCLESSIHIFQALAWDLFDRNGDWQYPICITNSLLSVSCISRCSCYSFWTHVGCPLDLHPDLSSVSTFGRSSFFRDFLRNWHVEDPGIVDLDMFIYQDYFLCFVRKIHPPVNYS